MTRYLFVVEIKTHYQVPSETPEDACEMALELYRQDATQGVQNMSAEVVDLAQLPDDYQGGVH